MEELSSWAILMRVIVLGVLVTVFSYAVVRSISFAYFRSKLEHFRTVMKEMRDHNGKG